MGHQVGNGTQGEVPKHGDLVSFRIMAKLTAEPEALRSGGGAPDASLPAAGHPLTDTSMGCLAPAHSAPLVGWPPLPLVYVNAPLRVCTCQTLLKPTQGHMFVRAIPFERQR